MTHSDLIKRITTLALVSVFTLSAEVSVTSSPLYAYSGYEEDDEEEDSEDEDEELGYELQRYQGHAGKAVRDQFADDEEYDSEDEDEDEEYDSEDEELGYKPQRYQGHAGRAVENQFYDYEHPQHKPPHPSMGDRLGDKFIDALPEVIHKSADTAVHGAHVVLDTGGHLIKGKMDAHVDTKKTNNQLKIIEAQERLLRAQQGLPREEGAEEQSPRKQGIRSKIKGKIFGHTASSRQEDPNEFEETASSQQSPHKKGAFSRVKGKILGDKSGGRPQSKGGPQQHHTKPPAQSKKGQQHPTHKLLALQAKEKAIAKQIQINRRQHNIQQEIATLNAHIQVLQAIMNAAKNSGDHRLEQSSHDKIGNNHTRLTQLQNEATMPAINKKSRRKTRSNKEPALNLPPFQPQGKKRAGGTQGKKGSKATSPHPKKKSKRKTSRSDYN